MSKELSIKISLCNEYQRLLEECQSALQIWNKHRAEIPESRLISRDIGDELLRLQANFARAYAVLQHHAHDCVLCELVSHIEGGDFKNSWDAHSDSTPYV